MQERYPAFSVLEVFVLEVFFSATFTKKFPIFHFLKGRIYVLQTGRILNMYNPHKNFCHHCPIFQVLLHDQTESPEMTDLGFVVAPGTHTLVTVNQKQVGAVQSYFAGCQVPLILGSPPPWKQSWVPGAFSWSLEVPFF